MLVHNTERSLRASIRMKKPCLAAITAPGAMQENVNITLSPLSIPQKTRSSTRCLDRPHHGPGSGLTFIFTNDEKRCV